MPPSELTEDLKSIPRDLRAAARDVNTALERAEDERPGLAWALDVRVVLTAAALALLFALVTRFAGAGFVLALLVFLVLFAGIWAGITRAAAARRPTKPE